MEVWYLFVVEIGFPHAHAPNARSVHYQYFGPNKVTLVTRRGCLTLWLRHRLRRPRGTLRKCSCSSASSKKSWRDTTASPLK
jgi:hypothetical protein